MSLPKDISSLPINALVKIFDHVPNKISLKLTCKDWYRVICQNEYKRYRLKIGMDQVNILIGFS